MSQYPLPQDTVTALKHRVSVQNAGLMFDRFSPDLSRVLEREKGKVKKAAFEAVMDAANKNSDTQLLAAWQKRWQLIANETRTTSFTLKTDWRLIAGLGRKGPLEVGFTFNRYGFPIIPGSSLKGLARAWGFFQIAEKLGVPPDLWSALEELLLAEDTPEKKAHSEALEKLLKENKLPPNAPIRSQKLAAAGELSGQWRRIFGTQEQAGEAIFLDAIPASLPRLELDIMNPHYPDYYGGNAPPTDWQNPIPIYFLTVVPHTKFCFAVGWRGAKVDESLRQVAEDWLKAGLTELGAGAKTSAGYGYFQPEAKMAGPVPDSTVRTGVAPSTPTPSKPAEPLVWRSGTIVGSIDTSRTRRGKVEDIETKKVYEFHISAIKGDTPGKKARVEFALQNGKVVAVRRK